MNNLAYHPSIAKPVKPVHTTEQVIAMWLHGKSPETISAYSRITEKLINFIDKPLTQWALSDLQRWQDSLTELSPNTQRTYTAIAKSLVSFAHKLGVVPFNVSMPIKAPKSKDCLSQRILSESQVLTIIALESNPRNKLILKVLYYAGLRVSELCNLTWEDLTPNNDSGQLTVFGKGGKTRVVLLPVTIYRELLKFRGDHHSQQDPIFASRKRNVNNGRLTRFTVTAMVKEAALKAGIDEKASAHWLRHCHASHSLDRGANVALVSATLGHSSISTTSRYLHAKPSDSSSLYLPS